MTLQDDEPIHVAVTDEPPVTVEVLDDDAALEAKIIETLRGEKGEAATIEIWRAQYGDKLEVRNVGDKTHAVLEFTFEDPTPTWASTNW